jgi:signal peptidase I
LSNSAVTAVLRSKHVAGLLAGILTAGALAACGGGGTAATTHGSANASQVLGHQVYRVPSLSMEPTLRLDERVSLSPRTPAIGEIVVYHPPAGDEQALCGPKPHAIKFGGAACVEPVPTPLNVEFIKRVVAGPGDEIYIRQGHVYRKAAGASRFIREPDSYIRPCGANPECNLPTPIKVPAGHWYLLGDNRGASVDSRISGAIPTSWIVGVVTKVAKA